MCLVVGLYVQQVVLLYRPLPVALWAIPMYWYMMVIPII